MSGKLVKTYPPLEKKELADDIVEALREVFDPPAAHDVSVTVATSRAATRIMEIGEIGKFCTMPNKIFSKTQIVCKSV